MRVVLCPTLHQHEREVTLLDRLMHGTTDGAVLMLPEESNDELKALQRQGYPFVVVDPRVPLDEGIPVVSAAQRRRRRARRRSTCSRSATAGSERSRARATGSRATERLNGYHGALAAAGILPDPALVASGTSRSTAASRPRRALLDLPDPPTAIFAFNDNMAVGAMRAARARGLRVPEDLRSSASTTPRRPRSSLPR